ncbi:GM24621 [Drosophila sechellia]|uniref:GM24621 n=2 Tax=Drosophila sechellia TaxID=7238 RepID=B4HG83_DROSE|nr:GM24621 [Drosophila sechellia]
MKTQITDINHFAFFRILDILKKNCETQHGDETEDIIKYADILNFATASF